MTNQNIPVILNLDYREDENNSFIRPTIFIGYQYVRDEYKLKSDFDCRIVLNYQLLHDIENTFSIASLIYQPVKWGIQENDDNRYFLMVGNKIYAGPYENIPYLYLRDMQTDTNLLDLYDVNIQIHPYVKLT